VERRRFDHLMLELSLALDRNLPRYPVWLAFKETGADPERPDRDEMLEFFDGPLQTLLVELGCALPPRRRRRLRRALARFDPALPTPYEHMERIGSAGDRR
jgi:hypothetical protein